MPSVFLGSILLRREAISGESVVTQEGINYKRLFYQDGVLKGFILIGQVDRAGIYTSMIKEQTPAPYRESGNVV